MPENDEQTETRALLQQIIDGQWENVGPETAQEQAQEAGIELDDDGTIVTIDGSESAALDALRYAITGKEPDEEQEQQEGERQEYYLEAIRDIVDEQRELFGDDVALKQAHQAPLKIDEDGTITGFYGKGEDALAILRSYTEHQEFYLEVIQKIIDRISSLFGSQIALGYAHRAPLEVMPDGQVQAYYGKGRKALEILQEQIETDMGTTVADNQMRTALQTLPEDQWDLLPERIRPEARSEETDTDGLFTKIKAFLGFN